MQLMNWFEMLAAIQHHTLQLLLITLLYSKYELGRILRPGIVHFFSSTDHVAPSNAYDNGNWVLWNSGYIKFMLSVIEPAKH